MEMEELIEGADIVRLINTLKAELNPNCRLLAF
jgi:hypothetical protein